MKLISQIADECGVERQVIHNVIKNQGIIKCGMYVNKLQEDKIHQILYFESKISEITLESKLNKETENE